MDLSNKTKKVAYISFAAAVSIAVMIFFGKALYDSWNDIYSMSYDFNYAYLAMSFLFWLITLLLLAMAYHFLIVKLGGKPGFLKTAKARAFSDIGSYVPGKVAPLITRMHYLKGYASGVQIITSSAIEIAAVLLSSIFAFAVIYVLQPGIFAKYAFVFYALLPLCLVCMHPKVISFLLNLGLKLLRKEQTEIKLRYTDIIKTNLIYSLYWVISGIAVFLIILAVYPISISYFPYVMVSYAVAWVIGFLSFIVPAGIGVREGVLVYMLALYMPLPVALTAAVGARLLVALAHLVFMLALARA